MKTTVFWDVTQRIMVIPKRRREINILRCAKYQNSADLRGQNYCLYRFENFHYFKVYTYLLTHVCIHLF